MTPEVFCSSHAESKSPSSRVGPRAVLASDRMLGVQDSSDACLWREELKGRYFSKRQHTSC